MIGRIWMITLLVCLGSCAAGQEEEEDFGPYPTKSERLGDGQGGKGDSEDLQ